MKIIVRMVSPKTGQLEHIRGEVESKRQLRAFCELFHGGGYLNIEVSRDEEPHQWRAVKL